MQQVYMVAKRLKVGPDKWLMAGEQWHPSRPLAPHTERSLIRRGLIERVWVSTPASDVVKKKRGRPRKNAEVTA